MTANPDRPELDPHEVLGVAKGCSADDLRDAFRRQTKKHHPDSGGDAWAFRLLNKAYEILCCSRVAGWMAEEERRSEPGRTTPPPRPGNAAR